MNRLGILALALAVLLGGCMHSVRLNERGVVEAAAIDRTPEGGYTAVLQISAPEGKTGAAARNTSVLLEGTSDTLTGLFTDASVRHGKQLFLGSCRMILIGEEVAQTGVKEILDFFNANHQVSPTITVAVAQGEASALLKAQEQDATLTADVLLDIVKNGRRAGLAPESRLMDLVGAIASEHTAGTLALVALQAQAPASSTAAGEQPAIPAAAPDEPSASVSSEPEPTQEPKPRFALTGSAVFAGERLARTLDPKQTRGMAWVRGTVESASIAVRDEQLGTVAAVTTRQTVKIHPERVGDTLVFDIRVNIHSNALETVLPDGGTLSPDQKRYAAALQARDVRREIENALHMTQGQGLDLLGVSRLIAQRDPEYYQMHADDWAESFLKCGYNVSVSCEIDRSGVDNRLL